MITISEAESIHESLPPDLQEQALIYIEQISRKKTNRKGFTLSWAFACNDYDSEKTSVDIQHEASANR